MSISRLITKELGISIHNFRAKNILNYNLKNKEIAIQEGMSEAQTLKTMIHELTHSRLHDVNGKEEAENFDRKSAEVQAESVAFVVSNYFGLDTS